MANAALITEKFELPSSQGYAIHGEVKVSEGELARPVIVISHGFRGHKDWSFWPAASRWLAEQGFYTVIFNFSRLAATEVEQDEQRSAKAATLSQEIADVETVVAAVHQQGLPLAHLADPSAIGLLGHSRAGGSNLLFASEHQTLIQALAIWNGGAPPQRVLQEGESLSPREAAIDEDLQRNQERFDLDGAFERLHLPALLVQGGNDRQALLEQVKRFEGIAPHQQYVVIPDADHTFNVLHPYDGESAALREALQATAAFFKGKLISD